ncbi:MAG: ABC transporter, partial [Acidimicrobiales bacterium]
MVFTLALAGYLTVAALLVFHYHILVGDALARVANAYYVLYSRDPHLAAIGFVWNPLPSLAEILLLPFKALWPALVTDGFAGNILSAAAMAGAVAALNGTLAEARLRRPVRCLLVLGFAAHPLVVLYAGNGMSEAPFLLFLLLATRTLARWLRSGGVAPLVGTGVALGLAYLVRYETLAPGAVATGLVLVVGYARAAGDRRRRRDTALVEAGLVAAPFA